LERKAHNSGDRFWRVEDLRDKDVRADGWDDVDRQELRTYIELR
jgi:hypothetical protein